MHHTIFGSYIRKLLILSMYMLFSLALGIILDKTIHAFSQTACTIKTKLLHYCNQWYVTLLPEISKYVI